MLRPGSRFPRAALAGLAFLVLAGCAGVSVSRKQSADAHYRMAAAYFQQAGGIQSEVNRRAAYPELIEAIRLDPDSGLYHQLLGTLFLYNQEYPTAERETQRALALDPNLAEAHNNLGLIYLAQDRVAEAAAQLRKAIANLSYPTPEFAYYNLGKASYRLGDYAAAADAYERSLAILPGNEEGRFELGMSYARLGRLQEAEKAFAGALKMRQDSARTHYELGMVLFKLGRKPEAADQFRAVVALEPASELGEQSKTYLKLLR
jgi:type IV pilus assembly protein PilF